MEAIERRLDEWRTEATACAKARAEATYLEEFKRSKLAILQKKYEALGFASVAAQEREARADPEYVEYLEGLRAAIEEAAKLEYFLKISFRGSELWQSLQANKRAEIKAYGG